MGFGNTTYAVGDRAAAADAFRRASELHPDNGAAFNNLAVALTELGRLREARATAEKALALGGPWGQAARDTLASIQLAGKSRKP